MPQQNRSAGRHERRRPFLKLVPRSAHFPSQGHTSSKGATTTPPIPSPSHPCSRRQDSRNELRKARRTKHENEESISKKLSLLILNLEEGDITFGRPRGLKTKVLPVTGTVDKRSSASLARLVVGSVTALSAASVDGHREAARPRGRPSVQI